MYFFESSAYAIAGAVASPPACAYRTCRRAATPQGPLKQAARAVGCPRGGSGAPAIKQEGPRSTVRTLEEDTAPDAYMSRQS